jgi:hypothetical protein
VFVLPQFGIFAQGTHTHHFLEFDLKPGVAVAEAVAAVRGLRTPDVSAGGVNLVIAFGARIWRAVAPGAAPKGLAPFRPVGHAPATQHDVWLYAVHLAPQEVLLAAKAHPAPNQTGDELAGRLDELDVRLRRGLPEIGEVFIDVTAHHRRRGS